MVNSCRDVNLSSLSMFVGTTATSVSMVMVGMGSSGEAEEEEVGVATTEGATAEEETMLQLRQTNSQNT